MKKHRYQKIKKMNKKIKNFLIAIIVAIAAYFGYNVIINPPINDLTTTVDSLEIVEPIIDTLK